MFDSDPESPDIQADPEWEARLCYWRRRLGRLRLGVEPIDEQLSRYRRVTLMLTAVVCGVGLIFFSLFTAFGRPDVGFWVALVLLAPVVAFAWLDDAVLHARARAYLRELDRHRSAYNGKTPGAN
jgi:hypothetical protein